ncbi:META domain-containing protein [Arachidicoccus rhizosphaerae]|uniref:META domain-containing protein n=1 Tax=Arachidicoccus rhizosphaerae TaxID=551991 RepID=A0A1H3ZVM4_9BACT|nr:copper resistance protein NlpE N-terminal domain-containing protein [Arachidicoccus rhizosphaerae]SEA27342.1 META domain-containing protein [Arachidicoccus rhizosphaerae]
MKITTYFSGKYANQLLYCAMPLLISIGIQSCKNVQQTNGINSQAQINSGHNSQNSLDWAGVYQGQLPCADCSAIQTVITLNADGTFTKQYKYEGKGDSTYKENGTFSWDNHGGIIALKSSAGQQSYKVIENGLLQLDQSGNAVQGPSAGSYKLTKLDQQSIEEKYWKLTQLNGQQISYSGSKEPYMILKTGDSTVRGFAGCNGFGGHFELKPGNRILFSKMISTMMACSDLALEKQFMQVLNKADNYSQHGDTLYLNKARMAPLAQFVAVYLR